MLTDQDIDMVTDQQWAQNNHKPIYTAHRAYARAIEALVRAECVPPGHVVVPVETLRRIADQHGQWNNGFYAASLVRPFLSAAPSTTPKEPT